MSPFTIYFSSPDSLIGTDILKYHPWMSIPIYGKRYGMLLSYGFPKKGLVLYYNLFNSNGKLFKSVGKFEYALKTHDIKRTDLSKKSKGFQNNFLALP